jgi:hypothetical protein
LADPRSFRITNCCPFTDEERKSRDAVGFGQGKWSGAVPSTQPNTEPNTEPDRKMAEPCGSAI